MQEDNGCKILPKVVDAQKMIWKHRLPYPALSEAKTRRCSRHAGDHIRD